MAVIGRQADGVALAQLLLCRRQLFPQPGVLEIRLGQVQRLAAAQVAVNVVAACDLAVTHQVAVLHPYIALGDGTVMLPGQAIGAGVERAGLGSLGRGQLQAVGDQGLAQLHQGLRIGKVAGQGPAAGVAEVFLPQRDGGLVVDLFPACGVAEVFLAQVQALAALLADKAEHAATHRGIREIVGHAHPLVCVHSALALTGFVLGGRTQIAVNAAGQTPRAVELIHAHRVADLDVLAQVVALNP